MNTNYKNLNVLDPKQDFSIAENDKGKVGHLYEYNFKSTDAPFSTQEIEDFLEGFCDLTVHAEKPHNLRYTAHFTGIEKDENENFSYFKLILGFSSQSTLLKVEKNMLELYDDSHVLQNSLILSRRIIKNDTKATVETYLDGLNQFLEVDFPQYETKQITFEGIDNDRSLYNPMSGRHEQYKFKTVSSNGFSVKIKETCF